MTSKRYQVRVPRTFDVEAESAKQAAERAVVSGFHDSAWRLGERRDAARYAFAVFQGVVREVYQITQWLPAGCTFNIRWSGKSRRLRDRWDFVGVVAKEVVRRRYINRYVGHLFTQGAQNPISYVNLE